MLAYAIGRLEIRDPSWRAEYGQRILPLLEKHGGRYLVRGGAVTVLEGDWHPDRLVVVEFASVAAARAWWESPDYAELKALRQRSVRTEMVVVEGVPGKEIP